MPWKAPECARAATVHLGGTRAEIAASERAIWRGEVSETAVRAAGAAVAVRPDPRPGGQTHGLGLLPRPAWLHGDMTGRIEAQIERFAPGFRDLVLARPSLSPAGLERYNANYIGGDINGGVQDWRQLFFRPVLRPLPWTTPVPGLFLCSSSTPPGGGVHGMGGYWAAGVASHCFHSH